MFRCSRNGATPSKMKTEMLEIPALSKFFEGRPNQQQRSRLQERVYGKVCAIGRYVRFLCRATGFVTMRARTIL